MGRTENVVEIQHDSIIRSDIHYYIWPSKKTPHCIMLQQRHCCIYFNKFRKLCTSLLLHIIKQSPRSRLYVGPFAINSKATVQIIKRFSLIDRVVLEEGLGIEFVKFLCTFFSYSIKYIRRHLSLVKVAKSCLMLLC